MTWKNIFYTISIVLNVATMILAVKFYLLMVDH